MTDHPKGQPIHTPFLNWPVEHHPDGTHKIGGSGAPINASYITTASEPNLSNEKVLGSEVIMKGLLANRPAAGIPGRLFISTDPSTDQWVYRDNGAEWENILKPPWTTHLAELASKPHYALTDFGEDDHKQYLNTTRHDTTDRHTLGTVVPHDSLASLTEKNHSSLVNVTSDQHHPKLHKNNHTYGAIDAFGPSDFLNAIVKRLREFHEGGSTDLEMGDVPDGKYLKRSGTTIIGADSGGGSGNFPTDGKFLFNIPEAPEGCTYLGRFVNWVRRNSPYEDSSHLFFPRMGLVGFPFVFVDQGEEIRLFIVGLGRKDADPGCNADDYLSDLWWAGWDEDLQTLVWTLMTGSAAFPGDERSHAIGVSINRGTDEAPDWYGYIGTGMNTDSGFAGRDDVWQCHWNGTSLVWSTLPTLPEPLLAAVAGFVTGVKDGITYKFLVIGTGMGYSGNNTKFWFYDYSLVTPAWVELTATYPFPGGSRYGASAFTLGNAMYVFGGVSGGMYEVLNDLYKLTVVWAEKPTGHWEFSWTQMASMPDLPRESAVAYATSAIKATVGLGSYINASGHFISLGSIWEFDSTQEPYGWSQLSAFDGAERNAAVGICDPVNGVLFIIAGYTLLEATGGQLHNDVWQGENLYLMKKT
jgi:hypothetical protein